MYAERFIDELRNINLKSFIERKYKTQFKGNVCASPLKSGSDKTPSFHYYPKTNSFYDFSAVNKGGDIFEFVKLKEGVEFVKAVELIAYYENIKIEYDNKFDIIAYEQKQKEADEIEKTFLIFKAMLFEQEGSEALKYLTKVRKYDEAFIKENDFAFIPNNKKKIFEILEKNKTDLSVVENIFNFSQYIFENEKNKYNLIIAQRDKRGRILNFIVRTIANAEPKYLYETNANRNTPFNIHNTEGQDKVFIVDGQLKCLVLKNIYPHLNVVALGGTNNKAIEYLIKEGFKNLFFVPDLDGTRNISFLLAKHTQTILNVYGFGATPFIVRTDEIFEQDNKDVEDYFISATKTNFKAKKVSFDEKIENAEVGARLLGGGFGVEYLQPSNDTQQNEIIKKIEQTAKDLNPIAFEILIQEFCKRTGLDKVGFLKHAQDLKASEQEKKLIKDVYDSTRQINSLVANKEFDEVDKILKQITAKVENKNFIAKQTSTNWVDEAVERIKNTKEGMPTGFDTLDEYLKIPQGRLTLITGRPAHGKTAFMLNMAHNIASKKLKVAFLTFEDDKSKLFARLLMIDSELVLSSTKNAEGFEACLKGGAYTEHYDKINKHKKKLSEWAQGGLFYCDNAHELTIENLIPYLEQIKNKLNTDVFFIDYIQKINSKIKFGARYEEIGNVSAKLVECAINLNVAVVCGAQKGRPPKGRKDKDVEDGYESIRESGNLEQDAKLIIALNNTAYDKDNRNDTELSGAEKSGAVLEVDIQKNVDGCLKHKLKLEYNLITQKIADKKGGSSLFVKGVF